MRADFAFLDPDRARYLGEGYAYTAYRLRGRDDRGDWSLRLPRRPGSPWSDARLADLERELRFFARLADYDFSTAVPRDPLPLRDAGGRLLGGLHRFIPGTPLSVVLSQSSPLRGAARRALLTDLGRVLARLQRAPLEAARAAGLRETNLGREVYPALIEQAAPCLGPRTFGWLHETTEAFLAAGGSDTAPRVPIHADISGHHLLLDAGGRLAGVIDFADMLIADPALDFAGLLNDLTWRDLEVVWAHYDGPLDADAARRTRYYIAVAPLYQVVYGEEGAGPAERARGVRRLAARASRQERLPRNLDPSPRVISTGA